MLIVNHCGHAEVRKAGGISNATILIQILTGVLQLNKSSGHIQLVDQTGSIDCVIAQESDETQDHNCAEICLHPNTSKSTHSTNTFQCPYMQTWVVGSLVRIDR